MIIVGFITLDMSDRTRLIKNNVIQQLGGASYEMYMTHLFLISFFNHLGDIYLVNSGICIKSCWLILCMISSIIVGLIIRKWLNIPMVNFLKRRFL